MSKPTEPLLHAILQHAERGGWAGYTPGHKGGRALTDGFAEGYGRVPLAFDLGFMGRFDDLHAPRTIIAEAETHAARVFGAHRSYFLTNGSSCGLIALLVGALSPGQTILVPRNIHRSLMSGMILSDTLPQFVEVGIDPCTLSPLPLDPASIDPTALASADALFPVSPTYHGLAGDLAELSRKVRASDTWFFVDEAHGAHLPFAAGLPTPALSVGAHATVQSTHKTLQALTPSAMLHLAVDGPDPERLRSALRMVQSSSANYAQLASLDSSRAFMEGDGPHRLKEAIAALEELRERLNKSGLISAPCPNRARHPAIAEIDPTKLFLDFRGIGITGYEAAQLLFEQAGIGVELANFAGVLLIVTAADRAKDIERLGQRLLSFARAQPVARRSRRIEAVQTPTLAGELEVSPRSAFFADTIRMPFAQSRGHIAAESIVPYPPGVPALWPGERIFGDPNEFVEYVRVTGASVQANDPTLNTILVLR